MASVNLNMDALSATCQFLTDVSDLLSFSLTCSSLRPVATQRLISISPIRLTKGALIHKLHSFLFADAPARTPYVRTVQIVWGSEAHHQQTPDGEVCLLMHILSSCPNLDSMRVYLSKSAHLSPSPGNRCIIEAIGTLRNLRELTMHGWPWDAHALLCAIRTPLRVLRIQSDDHICLSVTCWYPTKLKYFLLHLMPTLEQLELSAFTVDPSLSRSGIPLEPLSTLPQYPSVRSLTIGYFIGRLLLDRLQHIFPSLDGALSIQNYHTTYTDTHAALNSARRNNEDSTWRKLDRLVCTPEVFYRIVVSLCCPIRLVMLRQVCIDTLRFVIEGLRANPVPRLQLELELLGRGFYVLHRGLFRPELAGTLTHLTLVFKYTKQPVCALAEAGPDPHPLAQLQWHHVYVRPSELSSPPSTPSSTTCMYVCPENTLLTLCRPPPPHFYTECDTRRTRAPARAHAPPACRLDLHLPDPSLPPRPLKPLRPHRARDHV